MANRDELMRHAVKWKKLSLLYLCSQRQDSMYNVLPFLCMV